MPTHNFTEAELELLSEEERAGLLEDVDNEDADLEVDETSPEDKAAAAALEAEAEAAAAAAAGMADPLKPAPIVEAVTDPAKQEQIAAVLDDQPIVEEGPKAAAFPKFEAPADSKEKLAEIERQLDEIEAKFDDGDIDAKERRAQSKALEQERRQLERLIDRAELSRDVSVETWTESTVPAFFASHTQYKPGGAMYIALDNEVRKIQAESANPFDPAILAKAHKAVQAEVRAAMGLPAEEAKPAPKTPGAKRDLPPSLANVPAADITDTLDNSEFAHLDRLQEKGGTAFEDALAKLNDEQMARYLASA